MQLQPFRHSVWRMPAWCQSCIRECLPCSNKYLALLIPFALAGPAVVLSYAKLFRTIITAQSYTTLCSSQGHKAVWSADGNVDYLGPKHAPLFTVAVTVPIFLWLPYTLLLFLGQWLHRCNCKLIDQKLMKIKPFLDAYYGPLKGKHHYWFGTLLLMRVVILLVSALIPANHSVILNFSVIVTFSVSVSATVLIFLDRKSVV